MTNYFRSNIIYTRSNNIRQEGRVSTVFEMNYQVDLTIHIDEIRLSELDNRGGVYLFYDDKDNLLYVGIAKKLRIRILDHITGNTHTKRYYHNFKKCSLIYESDELKRRILEYYLINTLNPPLNDSLNTRKIPRNKVPYLVRNQRCNGMTKNGKKCNLIAHTNGFCYLHGGNGITLQKIRKEAGESAVNEYLEKG